MPYSLHGFDFCGEERKVVKSQPLTYCALKNSTCVNNTATGLTHPREDKKNDTVGAPFYLNLNLLLPGNVRADALESEAQLLQFSRWA